jgi:hypothetical protein
MAAEMGKQAVMLENDVPAKRKRVVRSKPTRNGCKTCRCVFQQATKITNIV